MVSQQYPTTNYLGKKNEIESLVRMEKSSEIIANIRTMESSVLSDRKKINLILDIKNLLLDTSSRRPVKLAAMHALRRVFVNLLESGVLTSISQDGSDVKLVEFKSWVDSSALVF